MPKVGFRAAWSLAPPSYERNDEFERRPRKGAVIPVSYGKIGVVFAVADLVVISVLGATSRAVYDLYEHNRSGDVTDFLFVGVVSAVIFVVINQLRGLYRPDKLLQGKNSLTDVWLAWCLVAIVLPAIAFVAKSSTDFSRGASLSFFVFGLTLIPVYRLAARSLLAYAIENNLLSGRENIVLVGSVGHLLGMDVHENLQRHGYGVVEQIGIRLNAADSLYNARNILAASNRLKEIVKNNRVDEIFLALDIGDRRTLDLMMDYIRDVPIPVRLLFDRRTSWLLASDVADLGAARAVQLRSGPLTERQQWTKRMFDVVLSLCGLIALAPLFVIVAIAVRLDSPGPVLFRQRRAGFSGRIFRIYKFRTMTSLDDGDVVKQAQRDDRRVTVVGRILRRTSIDELPQLLNVLSGEMSLVGPRPHAISHDSEYSRLIATYALRHHMKPGLTGWAQVHGFRGETKNIEAMEARIKHDIWYVGHWSLLLDIKAIAMTVVGLVSPKDVY